MKTIIRVLAICASLGVFTLPAFAAISEPTLQTQTAQGQCTDENKSAWYADFTKNRTTDPTKAYEAAKTYLTNCPTEEGQIPAYLKRWVGLYEKEARKIKLNDLFLRERKYPEAQALAKQILADDPDYLPALVDLGYGGYVVAVTTNNEAGNADAIGYAKKAIAAIEGGKVPENWTPFKSKDDALGYLYYSIGFMERKSDPVASLAQFIKAAQFEGEIKKNAQTYAFIAQAYENDYAKQSADYEAKYKGKDETAESKLAVANINQLVDRIIDSLARAVASAGTDAASQANKTKWRDRLTELYKFRHNNSEAGLEQLIAGVMATPIPPVPTPLTTLPAAPATSSTTTPAATTATGTPANAGNGASGTNKSTNTGSATTAPKTTAPKTTTPSSETATTKTAPKPRNNHRRH